MGENKADNDWVKEQLISRQAHSNLDSSAVNSTRML